MTKNILGLLLFLFALTTAVNAQVSQSSLEFIRKFKAIEQDLVRERVYLHTDRDWYFHGDRI
ncbi:MAG: hypothetical protein MI700_09475, partial [Balneolales bacterium]|nr:hypothetical protein [Balneolales bacterium]